MLFLPQESLGEDVFCFTTSVHGGVSNTPYQSFNLGMHVKDAAQRVAINRELLRAIIVQQVFNRSAVDESLKTSAIAPQTMKSDVFEQVNIAPIKWLNQQHSAIVKHYEDIIDDGHQQPTTSIGVVGDENQAQFSEFYCDGIVSRHKNTPLVIMTADCLPIVIACTKSGQIAAVHAGWKGLLNDIIANAVSQFDDTSALRVWIGPSISQAHFQISADIVVQFSNYDFALVKENNTDKYRVNLVGIARSKFAQVGVTAVQSSTVCTYASQDCFSHRRSTHAGLPQTGRMATVIVRV